jgi:catechol-2,3-dioxygenase
MIAGLAELTLQASQLDVMEHFYREVIGLELLSREEERVWLAMGPSSRLGLWAPGPKEFGDRGGTHVHFAFSTSREQLLDLAQRLRDSGVSVEGPVEHPGGDRSVYFEDPAGNVVEAWDFFHDGQGATDGTEPLKS